MIEVSWTELEGMSGLMVFQSRDEFGTGLQPEVCKIKILKVTDSFVIMNLGDELTIMKKSRLEDGLLRLDLNKK